MGIGSDLGLTWSLNPRCDRRTYRAQVGTRQGHGALTRASEPRRPEGGTLFHDTPDRRDAAPLELSPSVTAGTEVGVGDVTWTIGVDSSAGRHRR